MTKVSRRTSRVSLALVFCINFFASMSYANDLCEIAFRIRSEHLPGARLLHEISPQLHLRPSIEGHAARQSQVEQTRLTKPGDKISAWLLSLDQTQAKVSENPELISHIESFFYRTSVIRPENVPESYFITQARIARNLGYGDVVVTNEMRAEYLKLLVKDQQFSLRPWITYLLGPDAQNYPTWMKYWILNGVVKLSIYDPEKKAFGIRNDQTVAPFPELNYEALAKVKEVMLLRLSLSKDEIKKLTDQELSRLMLAANFGQLYGKEITQLSQYGNYPFTTNEGKWVLYPRGSDEKILVATLEGRNTGWCTAGQATAKSQLEGGDFYVFYSRDETQAFTRPRLAIRMQGSRIAEIRGVGRDQNFDSVIGQSDVLENKLKEFGKEGQVYGARSRDMKYLTDIDGRIKAGEKLTRDDVRFLREIDREIQGFGYKRDPRIDELLEGRDLLTDIAFVVRTARSKITVSLDDFKRGNSKKEFYYGDVKIGRGDGALLDLLRDKTVIGNVSVDAYIGQGDLTIPPMKITKTLTIEANPPKASIVIEADVSHVELVGYSARLGDVTLPQSTKLLSFGHLVGVGQIFGMEHVDELEPGHLTSAGSLELPATREHWQIDRLIDVGHLIVRPGVKSLSIPLLTEAGRIELPESLEHLEFKSLADLSSISALPAGLKTLILGSAKSFKHLSLPQQLERLWLDKWTDARGLGPLPNSLKFLELDSLVKPDGLILTPNLETIWLPKLNSAKTLERPTRIDEIVYRGPRDWK